MEKRLNAFIPRYITPIQTFSHEIGVVEIDSLPRDGLAFPNNVNFYVDHLNQLGLAALYQDGNQEVLFGNNPQIQTGVRVKTQYTLTSFGQRFVTACRGTTPPLDV